MVIVGPLPLRELFPSIPCWLLTGLKCFDRVTAIDAPSIVIEIDATENQMPCRYNKSKIWNLAVTVVIVNWQHFHQG